MTHPYQKERMPIRTCIAYRRAAPDSELLRIVARPQGEGSILVPDPQRRLPGRGCWLTPTLQALEMAIKRGAFGRALRVSNPIDTSPVEEYLRQVT